jgi:hypothetical protein
VYILKLPRKRGKNSHGLTEEVRASYEEKYRTKKYLDSPIGRIREIEAVGPNKSYFRIWALKMEYADGRRANALRDRVEARQAAVQRMVREVSDGDLATLAEYDAYIEDARRVLRKMRDDRESFIRERAWKNAKPISIGKLYEQADEREKTRSYPS